MARKVNNKEEILPPSLLAYVIDSVRPLDLGWMRLPLKKKNFIELFLYEPFSRQYKEKYLEPNECSLRMYVTLVLQTLA